MTNRRRANAWSILVAALVLEMLMSCSAQEPAAGPAAPLPAGTATPRVLIAGHRGARGIAPENTLAGFQKALDLKVDMIELDVHLTRDDQLVVMHDPRVERTTDGVGHIRDFTLADIERLNAAAKFKGDETYPPQQVPTLQEVLDLVQGRCPINVEIKLPGDGTRYAGIERKVVDLIRSNNALSYTIVSSFDFPTLQDVQALEPKLATYAIISTAYFKEMGQKGKGPQDIAADMAAHGFRWVAVDKAYMSDELAAALKRAGLKTHAWVVNSVEEFDHFAALGVDYVTSDRPDVLLAATDGR